jgi:hypothetical protein
VRHCRIQHLDDAPSGPRLGRASFSVTLGSTPLVNKTGYFIDAPLPEQPALI